MESLPAGSTTLSLMFRDETGGFMKDGVPPVIRLFNTPLSLIAVWEAR